MSGIIIIKSDGLPAIRPLPDDVAVAAIGDVHGQDDLFEALLKAIDFELGDFSEKTIVQLGDLVDRGPGSIAALKRARAGRPGARFATLSGNHEAKMLRAILSDDPDEARHWLMFGGEQTLAEVGVSTRDPNWREAFADALGPELLGWISTLPASLRIGDLCFVHAGIDPTRPLAGQDRETLMWIRRPFLESDGPYPENVAVIHGHTPQVFANLSHPNRINLDTGAFASGTLSGLVIKGGEMRLVQARR